MESLLAQNIATTSACSRWSRIDDIFTRNRQRRTRALTWLSVAIAIALCLSAL
jgi:hypothetical protein